jgi:nicotinamidase-related amidase
MNYEVDISLIKEYNTHPLDINKEKAALLVIEMQETFRTDMGLISDKQITNVKKLIEFSETNKMPIVFVRHNDSSSDSINMISWWADKLEKGSAGWQMIPEIDTTNHIILDKSQYSSFYQTGLNKILKAHDVKDLIICGLMTNCCCETAARDAFMHGYNVFFVNDATATINADLHLAAIKNISFGFGVVANTNDICC